MNEEIPECCGKRMDIERETNSFVMVKCSKCGEIIYIKKESGKPKLIEFMG